MSFLKYRDRDEGAGGRGKLYWGRAGIDGAPYRGKALPLLREEEFEQLSERVYDCHVKLFDLSNSEQLKEYTKIVDYIRNGWFNLIYRDHLKTKNKEGNPCIHVYIEWEVPYQEIDEARIPPEACVNLDQAPKHDAPAKSQSFLNDAAAS